MTVPAFVGALGACVLMALGGFLAQPQGGREGQIVFARWEVRDGNVLDPTLGRVEVTSCEVIPEGLRVQGHVVAGQGVTSILVVHGDSTGSGIAVAAAFAAETGRIDSGRPGDFLTTLPWASSSARFSVADPDSLGPGPTPVRHGAATGCG